jgi:Uncharacterized conserved protein (DUF2278)
VWTPEAALPWPTFNERGWSVLGERQQILRERIPPSPPNTPPERRLLPPSSKNARRVRILAPSDGREIGHRGSSCFLARPFATARYLTSAGKRPNTAVIGSRARPVTIKREGWATENGIWQDGATIDELSDGRLAAFLNKFSTQSDRTDQDGHPA